MDGSSHSVGIDEKRYEIVTSEPIFVLSRQLQGSSPASSYLFAFLCRCKETQKVHQLFRAVPVAGKKIRPRSSRSTAPKPYFALFCPIFAQNANSQNQKGYAKHILFAWSVPWLLHTGRTAVPYGTDCRPFIAFLNVHRTFKIPFGNRQ